MNSVFEQLIQDVCCGDADAEQFVRSIVQIAHVWDDLVDRDIPAPDDLIDKAFWLALVEIPANPFYQRNGPTLRALTANSIINWQIATRVERSGEEGGLEFAYILRSSFVDLLTQTALILGGPAHAVAVGERVRRATHHEGFAGYVKALAAEAAERGG